MTFYYICLILNIVYLCSFIYLLTQNLYQKQRIFPAFIFCLLLTLIFKCDFGVNFLGLEYEDSYCFSAFARQIEHGIFPSSFRVDCVSIGSLEHPYEMGTYGGHFILFPTYLSIFSQLFGFSIQLISIVNSFTSFLILFTLSNLPSFNKNWMLYPLLFCLAPIINIYNTAFLAETYSSLLCLSFLWAYIYYDKKNVFVRFFCVLAFFMSILCKRENFVLLIVPIIYNLDSLKIASLKKTLKNSLPYILSCTIFILVFHNIFLTEFEEAKDINNPTFAWEYFKSLAPVFLYSLLSINYFSICFYILIILIIATLIHNKKLNRIQVICITLYVSYFLMYTFHYRGYYFVTGKESVSDFETFRYLNNFFYLIPVIFASSNFDIKNKYFINICLTLLVIFSIIKTYCLRNNLSDIEFQNRISEYLEIEHYITTQNNYPNTILITNTELLSLNYGPSNFNICSIHGLQNLNLNIKNMDYYIFANDWDIIKKRYNVDLEKYHTTEIKILKSGKKLLRIEHK